MKSASAIAFELRPSGALVALLGATALLAVLSIWASGLRAHPWIAASLGFLVVFSAARVVGGLLDRRWHRAGWNADGAWTLLDASQSVVGATLLGWSGLGLALVLRLRTTAGQAVTVCLLPDNLDRDTRRRLRIRLEQEASSLPPTSR
jgi:toxin CptA